MKYWIVGLLMILVAGCQVHKTGESARPTSQPQMQLGEVGNGGHGIVRKGRVYAVDLVEAGLELDPFFSLSHLEHSPRGFNSRFLERLRQKFGLSLFPVIKLALKLHEIYLTDPLLALSIFQTIEMFQWTMADRDLLNLPLRGKIQVYDEGELILVANRRGRTIYISRPAWNLMDDSNRVAILIHESVGALIAPEKDPFSADGTHLTQNAFRAREITAGLFNQQNLSRAMNESLAFLIKPGELPFLMINYKPRSEYFATTFDSFFEGEEREKKAILCYAQLPLVVRSGGKNILFELGDDFYLLQVPTRNVECSGIQQVKKACEMIYNKTKGRVWPKIYIDLVPSKDSGGSWLSNHFELSFSEYTSQTEVVTYIKFSSIDADSLRRHRFVPIPASSVDLDQCVFAVKTAVWNHSLAVDYQLLSRSPEFSPEFERVLQTHPLRKRGD